MRGEGPGDKTITANDLNRSFIGESFTVDLSDGTEFSSRLDGLVWAPAGDVTIYFPVTIDGMVGHSLDLHRSTQIMFTEPDPSDES